MWLYGTVLVWQTASGKMSDLCAFFVASHPGRLSRKVPNDDARQRRSPSTVLFGPENCSAALIEHR